MTIALPRRDNLAPWATPRSSEKLEGGFAQESRLLRKQLETNVYHGSQTGSVEVQVEAQISGMPYPMVKIWTDSVKGFGATAAPLLADKTAFVAATSAKTHCFSLPRSRAPPPRLGAQLHS
jgi:hypothetical protein